MTRRLSIFVAAGCLLAPVSFSVPVHAAEQDPPLYLDPDQPLEARIDDLIGRLTLAEKGMMLSTTAPAIARLEIPLFSGWNQCLRGIQWSEPTTMFPCPIGMAASWNTALVHQVASVIGAEGRAVYNHAGIATPYWPNVRHNGLVYRSPVLNISRDPRWGRIAEVWGEDPHLTGRMGVAFIKGMQGDHPRYVKLAATPKHYAVNNQERGRQGLNAEVPMRMLMEYWMPHFRAAIEEGRAQSIMAAMNAINGVPCSANEFLMTTLLKEQWGFDGFAVPDSGGVRLLQEDQAYASTMEEAVAYMIKAGVDVDDRYFADLVPRAVQQGLLTEAEVDNSLRRVFRVRFRLGEFDPPEMVPYNDIPSDIIASPEHIALALRMARESMVLLKNEGDLLPLDPAEIRTIAVIGPLADTIMLGANNYAGKWTEYVVPLAGIRDRAGLGIQILHAKGCDVRSAPDREATFAIAVDAARRADVALVFVGLNDRIESEGRDREDITLPEVQEDLIRAVFEANPRTVVSIVNGGPVTMREAHDYVPAMIEMFYAGQEGGNAVADVIFGHYNPAGRLPYTVYTGVDQIPPQTEYDVTKGFTYLYLQSAPQFAFGHGLSYTTFDYANLRLSAARMRRDGEVNVGVDVRNTGPRAGDEVVQLYVRDVEASVQRPIKELVGFERIPLDPGQTQTVTFTLPASKLAFFDVDANEFVVEPGTFEIMAGGSSDAIRLSTSLTVTP